MICDDGGVSGEGWLVRVGTDWTLRLGEAAHLWCVGEINAPRRKEPSPHTQEEVGQVGIDRPLCIHQATQRCSECRGTR